MDLIRNSGELVTMTVVSRSGTSSSSPTAIYETKYTDWQTTAPLGYATLPNKFRRNRSSSSGDLLIMLMYGMALKVFNARVLFYFLFYLNYTLFSS